MTKSHVAELDDAIRAGGGLDVIRKGVVRDPVEWSSWTNLRGSDQVLAPPHHGGHHGGRRRVTCVRSGRESRVVDQLPLVVPCEALRGTAQLPSQMGAANYDQPPRDRLHGRGAIETLRAGDRVPFAHQLRA